MQNQTSLPRGNISASPKVFGLFGIALFVSGIVAGCANITSTALTLDKEPTHPVSSELTTTDSSSFNHTETLFGQRISGKVLGEDGKTPVSAATIYIANYNAHTSVDALSSKRMINDISLNSLSSAVSPCAKPIESYITLACSRADGSFELTIPQITQLPLPLIFIKDGKKVEIAIDLNDLGTNIGTVAFDIPEPHHDNIAIVLDLFNPYEDIRNQLKTRQFNSQSAFLDLSKQLSEVFDIDDSKAEISFPNLQSLFEDDDKDGKIDIFNYDIVYINSQNQADIAKLDKPKKQILLKYISRGGQLYITEWTIELPEIPLDQYI